MKKSFKICRSQLDEYLEEKLSFQKLETNELSNPFKELKRGKD